MDINLINEEDNERTRHVMTMPGHGRMTVGKTRARRAQDVRASITPLESVKEDGR